MIGHQGFKIRDVALLVMLAVIIPLSGIASFSTYFFLRNEISRNTDSELEIAATFVHEMLGPDYHNGIQSAGSISNEAFDEIVERNNSLCKKLQLEYIWSLMILDGEIVFTSSTSPNKTVENGKHATFLEKHSAPEHYKTVFQTMEIQYHNISDKWGNIRAVLIPHQDIHGRKYLVGASKKLTEIHAIRPFLIRNTATITLIFLVPGILLSIYFSHRIEKPIRKLAQKTEELGQGNFSIQLEKSGITELDILVQEFMSMKDSFVDTLRELEKFLDVVSNSPIMIYRVTANEEMTTEFISENYTQLGYSLDDLRNNTIKWNDLIPAEDLERVDKIVKVSLAAGSDNHSSEIRMRWADGNHHWYKCWNQFVRDKDGNIVSIQGIMSEITDLKDAQERDKIYQQKLEHAIQELQTFYQVISSSRIFVYRVRADESLTTEFLSDNYALIGYDMEKLRSGEIKWSELVPEEDLEKIAGIVEKTLNEGRESYTADSRIRWENGEMHWYKTWNHFIRNSDQSISIQGIMMDITDLKEARDRDIKYQDRLRALTQDLLQAEDKERRQLAIALHDDIGQMLAALNMKLSAIDEAEDEDFAKSLRTQIHELLSRIMLTTKSLTWEISPTSLYETDIAAGMERMAEEIKELFGLETSIQSAGQRIVLDRNTSAIIFRCAKELLVNVAKHAGVSKAEIGVSHYGGKAHLVVSDDGRGFDPSNISKGNRKSYGLFSIQERIEHLGGSTRIESSPGNGTKVMIIIPVDIAETLGE